MIIMIMLLLLLMMMIAAASTSRVKSFIRVALLHSRVKSLPPGQTVCTRVYACIRAYHLVCLVCVGPLAKQLQHNLFSPF